MVVDSRMPAVSLPLESSAPGFGVLLVEDDPQLQPRLVERLRAAGVETWSARSAEEALDHGGGDWRPDVVLVDLLLPRLELYAVVRALRSAFAAPVVLGVATAGKDAVASGLADHELVRPLEPAAVVAKVQLLRGLSAAAGPLTFGRVTLDRTTRCVAVGDRRVPLSADEFRLMACLAARVGETVERRELVRALAGVSQDVDPRIVDVHIVRLIVKFTSMPEIAISRDHGSGGFRFSSASRESA